MAHCASINARNWKGNPNTNKNNVNTVAQSESESALQQVPPAAAIAARVEHGFMSRQLRRFCLCLCLWVRLRFRLQFQLQFTHRLIVFLVDGQLRLLQLAAVVSPVPLVPLDSPFYTFLVNSCLQLIEISFCLLCHAQKNAMAGQIQ